MNAPPSAMNNIVELMYGKDRWDVNEIGRRNSAVRLFALAEIIVDPVCMRIRDVDFDKGRILVLVEKLSGKIRFFPSPPAPLPKERGGKTINNMILS
jgi:hypothetical protein